MVSPLPFPFSFGPQNNYKNIESSHVLIAFKKARRFNGQEEKKAEFNWFSI